MTNTMATEMMKIGIFVLIAIALIIAVVYMIFNKSGQETATKPETGPQPAAPIGPMAVPDPPSVVPGPSASVPAQDHLATIADRLGTITTILQIWFAVWVVGMLLELVAAFVRK